MKLENIPHINNTPVELVLEEFGLFIYAQKNGNKYYAVHNDVVLYTFYKDKYEKLQVEVDE